MAETNVKTDEPQQDQSMEEILQSIRRIIAEESDDVQADKPGDKSVKGSEVLELTEMVKEDGSVESVTTPAPPTGDVLSSIDAALATPKPAEAPAPPPPAPPAAVVAPPAPTPPPPSPTKEAPVTEAKKPEPLVSKETATASAASIKAIADKPMKEDPKIPSPAMRSGDTLEDLMLEALRPMLKDWLDKNLQGIVERIVEREVKRIAALNS